LADVLNAVLAEDVHGHPGQSKREALCRMAVLRALDGDMKALGWVADRAEGRAAQQVVDPLADFAGPVRVLDFGDDPVDGARV